ncbi:glycosyltransferase [Luteimonas changyuni]|uniref:glycosyltransferase n=1 Tax=Luteimonas sp. MJ145 TaxID=3129234 RepID=UPI0031BA86CE
MPRIALVTPNLPVPHDLARGRYIHETARALSRLADVRVYFPQVRHPRLPGLAPRTFLGGIVGPGYALEGIELESYTYPGFPGLSRASNGLVGGRALAPRLRGFAPDIVLAYWVYPDGHAALHAARALGVPCIVGGRGSDIHMRSGVSAWLTRKTLHGADAVLTVSQAMRRAVIDDFGVDAGTVRTIVNGVDTAVFQPRDRQAVRGRLGIDPRAKLVTYVGRLIESKGMQELLEAFSAVHARDPEAMLALVGDGVMRERLAGMVAASGLSARVRMTGGVGPEQVAEWIAASDVLTLPSWSEGYPNVLVEALACGCPVVATDVGGSGEIVAAGSGILVPVRDPVRLAEALDEALARTWDHAAIARAMARSWDDVARETLSACTDVLAARTAMRPPARSAGVC